MTSSPYTSPQAAFKALGDAHYSVRSAEARLRDAEAAEQKARSELQRARNRFNEIRDDVIELCPELLEGYSNETVTVIDGKVTVVKDST